MVDIPSETVLEETPGRALTFLRGVTKYPQIQALLVPSGYLPEQHGEGWTLLLAASGAPSTTAVVGVETLLTRLDALETGKDRPPASHAEDKATLVRLAERGIPRAERDRLLGLVQQAKSLAPATAPRRPPRSFPERRGDVPGRVPGAFAGKIEGFRGGARGGRAAREGGEAAPRKR
jgi:hypothetical protein